ncbi:MAG: 30S ribosome-binding factor RbfA [Emticicia sp.]|nr:30S ribosome-binding factor RbfA [Emticicia sp.]
MESKRQRQVAKQIQKDLGEIFQKDLKQMFNGAFVTITEVKITPDLGIARAYLSFLLTKDKEGVLQIIRENTKNIRNLLGERVRHQLRIVPNLQFFIDDTAEYAQKMDALFAGIVIPPEEDTQSSMEE